VIRAFIYRYPHPNDPAQFIYVGQERREGKRDRDHRSGKSSFGRRFKHIFPDTELPQPIRKEVIVPDVLTLNGEEIIWMFQYHTWHGYPGGMNLTMPGSHDYKNFAHLGGRRVHEIHKNIAKENGRKGGLALMALLTPEQRSARGHRVRLYINLNPILLTPEQRSERSRIANAYLTPGQRKENGRKGGLAASKSVTQEKRLEIMKKTIAVLTPKQLSENGKRGVHKQWHLNLSCKFCVEQGLNQAA